MVFICVCIIWKSCKTFGAFLKTFDQKRLENSRGGFKRLFVSAPAPPSCASARLLFYVPLAWEVLALRLVTRAPLQDAAVTRFLPPRCCPKPLLPPSV